MTDVGQVDVSELSTEEIGRIVETWQEFDTETVDSLGRDTRSRIRQTLAYEQTLATQSATLAAMRAELDEARGLLRRCQNHFLKGQSLIRDDIDTHLKDTTT